MKNGSNCPKCGSSDIKGGLIVSTDGPDRFDYPAVIGFRGNNQGWIKPATEYRKEYQAWNCGKCGYTEFYTVDSTWKT